MLVKTPRAISESALDETAGAQAISILVDKWFAENTFHADEFSDLRQLLELKEKQGSTISLALPALDEEETVGKVIQTIKTALMDEVPLLDEIVLIDSDFDGRNAPDRRAARHTGVRSSTTFARTGRQVWQGGGAVEKLAGHKGRHHRLDRYRYH